MMISPTFMVVVKGLIDFEFDDFNEIKEHLIAGPIMVNFSDFLEGMMEKSVEDTHAVFERNGEFEALQSKLNKRAIGGYINPLESKLLLRLILKSNDFIEAFSE